MRFAASALLFLTACPDTRPTPETFCRQYANALTDFRVRCGEISASGGEDLHYVLSGLTCQVNEHITFDRDAAKKCLAEFETVACGARELPCEDPPLGEGRVAAGGSCFEGECAPGLYCDWSTGCPGHCEPRIAVGAPAVGRCVAGAWPLEGVCAQRVSIGESCAALPSLERPTCAYGAVCGSADLCIEYRGLAAGEYCNEGENLFCGYGLQCLGDGCEPLSKAGEACSQLRGCQWDLLCLQGTCVSLLGEGEECASANDCRSPFMCIESSKDGLFRCAKRQAAGASCVGAHFCAAGLACVGPYAVVDGILFGECGPPLGRGASCETLNGDDPCDQGLHCGTSKTCVDLKTSGKCTSSRECQSRWCELDGGCAESCFPPAP